jgi:hypothetical protein
MKKRELTLRFFCLNKHKSNKPRIRCVEKITRFIDLRKIICSKNDEIKIKVKAASILLSFTSNTLAIIFFEGSLTNCYDNDKKTLEIFSLRLENIMITKTCQVHDQISDFNFSKPAKVTSKLNVRTESYSCSETGKLYCTAFFQLHQSKLNRMFEFF